MSTLIALLTLALMTLSSFFTDGSVRNFDLNTKKGVAPLAVTFSSQTLKDAKLAEKFIWTFGDGQTLTTTTTSVLHTYTTAGTFTAKLQYLTKATDAISKVKDGGSVKIVVTPKPNSLPVPQLSCVSNEFNKVECDPTGSVDSDGSIASYKYDWGDTTTTVATNLNKTSHTYTTSGEKTIRLIVTDNLGATAFIEKNISVRSNTAPVAAFTCTKTGVLQIHCTNNSTDAEETLTNFNWTLDDGTVYTTKDFDHTFNKSAQDVAISSHTVTLLATDSQGLTSTLTKSVDVTLEALTSLPRGYFKVFMDGTNVNLHSFITKTQFDIKRAYYKVYGTSTTLLQTVEISEFYANTVNKINLGAMGGYKIIMVVVDMRDQVYTTSQSFNLTDDTFSLAPYINYRAVQSAPRTLYLNLNPSFDYDEYFFITDFTVDMGDGVQKQIVDDTFLTYTYAQAGTYNIKITANTVHGTTSTITKSITVTDDDVAIVKPDATFMYEIYDYAQNVSFYNEKSGTPNGEIISYVWDFGDGSTATGETQAHFYAPGSYLVSLKVTDTAGLTSTQTQKVTILTRGSDLIVHINCTLAAAFVDVEQKCEVVALDKLNDISSVKMIWGDNTASTLTTPADAAQGLYYPTKKYTAPGTYAVKGIVTTNRGTTRSTTRNITLTSRPPVATLQCFTNNLMANCNSMGSYDPKGGPLTFTFDYQDGFTETNTTGISSHAYQDAGTYNVSVTVADNTGLSSVATAPVQIIIPKPVANLQCTSNNLMAFCNALGSYDPSLRGLTYEFNYGDGFTESNLNGISSHAYTSPGFYNINLKITNSLGGTAFASSSVQALLPPNKLPNPQLYCYSNAPNILRCNSNASNDEDGSIISFKYDWDDNASEVHAGSEEIFHIFTTSGSHQVTLTVTDNDGGMKSITNSFNVQANNPPVAVIFCYNIGPQKIHCNSNSYDTDLNDMIVEYKWDLGDGSAPIATMIPSIEYASLKFDTYTISLQVKDLTGATASTSQSITALENQAPLANLNCFITTGSTYQCNANASDPDGQIVESTWTIEGQTFAGESVLYDFTNGGDKNIVFLAKDDLGKTTTKTIVIHIDKPTASFACSEVSPMVYQCFSDNIISSDPNDPIAKVEYVFDNRDLLQGLNVEYEFYSFGHHVIQINVVTINGVISTFKQNILINQKYLAPRPEFIEDVLLGQKVYFDGSLSEQVGRAVSKYEWNFGDGQTLSTIDPVTTHQYNSYGWFDVKLKVTDGNGVIAESTTPIYVYDPEVEAVGDEGIATIEGVDTDNNGIRDDVQRWINKNSFESTAAKKAFKELAEVYKNQIANSDNLEALQASEDQKATAAACVDIEIVGEHNVTKSIEFELIYLNSNERYLNFAKIKGNLSGYVPNVTVTSATDPCAKWR
ncbi:MAG: PKD domain-containing protein [Rhizobacter sp.]|nr:PKD domain-containing protein [Bacteriovorax sp.]